MPRPKPYHHRMVTSPKPTRAKPKTMTPARPAPSLPHPAQADSEKMRSSPLPRAICSSHPKKQRFLFAFNFPYTQLKALP